MRELVDWHNTRRAARTREDLRPLAPVEEVSNAHEERQGRRAGGDEDITRTISGTLSPVGGGRDAGAGRLAQRPVQGRLEIDLDL